jgi:hypothetical protein
MGKDHHHIDDGDMRNPRWCASATPVPGTSRQAGHRRVAAMLENAEVTRTGESPM